MGLRSRIIIDDFAGHLRTTRTCRSAILAGRLASWLTRAAPPGDGTTPAVVRRETTSIANDEGTIDWRSISCT
jgi:hypothetical protein